MTTDDPNVPSDLTYADALAAAQPRIAELGAHLTALADQVLAAWQEVEPAIRAWVAQADTLTEQQWMDEAIETLEFYEFWTRWFAEHDRAQEGEDI